MNRPTKFAGLAVLLMLGIASLARADDYLGTVFVYDGGTANNMSTTCRDAGVQGDGGAVVPDGGPTDTLFAGCGFPIQPGAWLTVQCRQDCHVNTDVAGCDAGRCPRLGAEQWLSMQVAHSKDLQFTRFDGTVLYDGGLSSATVNYKGGLVAVSPADAGSTCTCEVLAQPEFRR